MKRVILVIGLLVFTGIFTSCTDIAEEVEKNAKFEEQFINHDEIGDEEEDQQEGS
ncbi:hypothetical protein [Tenacibaculum maritimum]|uniref:hypothetical protein n=1 Tax=Tenacibaculum maritimum TaxID=107401 RepID=UPI00133067AA|nr:hypothetical protein [Tenacibaculum maritimum]MDB0602724.1 hypothetical protein [Tenacibaculum maritimum]MDB0612326.1 hypothetical protein [Tenacibaculum maritimum]